MGETGPAEKADVVLEARVASGAQADCGARRRRSVQTVSTRNPFFHSESFAPGRDRLKRAPLITYLFRTPPTSS